ncbi:MAG: hypothetical protein ACYC7D_00275 [Nitrososphaerales archaeon]
MSKIKLLAIALFIFSIALGAAYGLLIPNDQPPSQKYSIVPFAVHTAIPIQCNPIPKNYSNWLGISIVGNRTAMNFQSVTVYSIGYNIRIDLPLNRTSFSKYKVTNSSLETIYVGLPDYFNAGDVIQVSVTYFISGFAVQSTNPAESPINIGQVSC